MFGKHSSLKRASRSSCQDRFSWRSYKHCIYGVFATLEENKLFQCGGNVVRVVTFQLGRLKNTAPVDKSELSNCVDSFFGLGGSWVAFCNAFGKPFDILCDTLGGLGGHFGSPWNHLGPPWPARGCSGMLLRPHVARLGRFFSTVGLKVWPGREKK